MDLWNRLRRLAQGVFAGGDAGPEADDAIYLTETAYRNRQSAPAGAPDIRERHFGLGSRRERTARTAPVPAAGPGDYAGTRIAGAPRKPPHKPHGPRGREAPAPTPVPALKLAPDDDATLRRLFGAPRDRKQEEAVRPSAPARAPAPASTPAPLVKPVVRAKRKKMDRSDVVAAALGVTLAAVCAVFPWYIFFNQEKFGVREFVFSGNGEMSRSAPSGHVAAPVGQPFASAEVPKMELDFFPTATLPSARDARRAIPASEQPFPSDLVEFRLVHVANGRAMIEDADGLWVVQRGSRLPDASVVAAIEQRGGRWVLVTSHDKVIELGAN